MSGNDYDFGYGYSYGDGDGFGEGHGDGYGYGDGFGDGNGVYGIDVGEVREHKVVVNPTWRIVEIDCRIHSFDYWVTHWRSIAREEGVKASDVEAARMIRKVRTILERVSP